MFGPATTTDTRDETLAAIRARRTRLHHQLRAAEAAGDRETAGRLRDLWLRLEAERLQAEAAATPGRWGLAVADTGRRVGRIVTARLAATARLGTGEFGT